MSDDEIVEKVIARLCEHLRAPRKDVQVVLQPSTADTRRWYEDAARIWDHGWDARAQFERGAEPENPYRKHLEQM